MNDDHIYDLSGNRLDNYHETSLDSGSKFEEHEVSLDAGDKLDDYSFNESSLDTGGKLDDYTFDNVSLDAGDKLDDYEFSLDKANILDNDISTDMQSDDGYDFNEFSMDVPVNFDSSINDNSFEVDNFTDINTTKNFTEAESSNYEIEVEGSNYETEEFSFSDDNLAAQELQSIPKKTNPEFLEFNNLSLNDDLNFFNEDDDPTEDIESIFKSKNNSFTIDEPFQSTHKEGSSLSNTTDNSSSFSDSDNSFFAKNNSSINSMLDDFSTESDFYSDDDNFSRKENYNPINDRINYSNKKSKASKQKSPILAIIKVIIFAIVFGISYKATSYFIEKKLPKNVDTPPPAENPSSTDVNPNTTDNTPDDAQTDDKTSFNNDSNSDKNIVRDVNLVNTDLSVTGDSVGFSNAIKKALPSVVEIKSSYASQEYWGSIVNYGSGVVFSQDDKKVYILTNNHVIENSDNNIKVDFTNINSSFTARIVGTYPNNDLAVISVLISDIMNSNNANPTITTAEFASTKSLEVGDFVVAIGNSLGAGTVSTVGIISAKNKEINVDGKTLKVLQTDAAMNPGNSGGALVNLKGHIVGINTAKVIVEAEGMAYAIGTDDLLPIVKEIMGIKN